MREPEFKRAYGHERFNLCVVESIAIPLVVHNVHEVEYDEAGGGADVGPGTLMVRCKSRAVSGTGPDPQYPGIEELE